MKLFRQYAQAFRISVNHLSSSLVSTIVTFLVIGITLALPVGLYILIKNIQTTSHQLHTSTQMTLYLDKNTTETELQTLLNSLKNEEGIQEFHYISPEEGLKTFGQALDTEQVLESLGNNPLPPVIVVQPIQQDQLALTVQQLAERMKSLAHVEEVQLDTLWLQRLQAILDFCHRIVLVLGLFFSLAVLLIIGNTIKLVIENYRHEIMVMQFLGASHAFIRRPFLWGGMMAGLMGAIIAWLLVDIIIGYLKIPLENLTHLYGSYMEIHGLDFFQSLALLFLGCVLGWMGAWFALFRQFQKMNFEN